MHSQTEIIILAAGKGKRMMSSEPKALSLLKGKPFLNHILDTIKSLDPKIKPVIVIGHNKERIKEVLGSNHIYAEQNEQLGTGHAVMSAKNFTQKDHHTVVVISADQPLVSRETLEKLISTHKDKSPIITLTTATLPDFREWRTGLMSFGRILRDENNKIQSIVEYKDASNEEKKIQEVNLALYAFSAEWLWANIDNLKNQNAQGEYLLTDLVKIACEQKENIESVEVENILEALQPNSKEELGVLENLI